MRTYKFGKTMDGVGFDEIIDKMKSMISYEQLNVYDFDSRNYRWVIGADVMERIRCTSRTSSNPYSILGIDVEVVDWDSRNRTSIFLNANKSRPCRVSYGMRRTARSIDEYPISHVKIIPKKVIFNDPATIVFWCDGIKTVVKAKDESFDPEKGLAMAYAKRASGNTGSYYNEFKKWLPKEEKKECSNCKYLHRASVVEPCHSCIISETTTNWEKADE